MFLNANVVYNVLKVWRLTDWPSYMPGSRDAIASKNARFMSSQKITLIKTPVSVCVLKLDL